MSQASNAIRRRENVAPALSIRGMWRFAVRLGWRSREEKGAQPWDLLVRPMDFIRMLEYQTVFGQVALTPGSRICDVSSPKLPAVQLSQDHQVVCGDLFRDDVMLWHRRAKFAPVRPHMVVFDGTKLPFKSESFDMTYSISVLEHIEGDGDRLAAAEIARVTRSGGYVAINVPFHEDEHETYFKQDIYSEKFTGAPLFFSRKYSTQSLRERLLHPSVDWGQPTYVFERTRISRLVLAIPRPPRWGITATAPIWAALMYGTTNDMQQAQVRGRKLMEVTMIGRRR